MLGEYKNNKARIPEGIQKLKSEKNIYLYGNADYAKRMFDVLNRFQIEIKGVLVSREYWREEIFYNNVVYKAEEFFENTHESIVLVAGFDIRIHKELLDRLIAEKFVKTIYVLNGCEIFWNNWNYVPDSKVFLIDNYYGGGNRKKFKLRIFHG